MKRSRQLLMATALVISAWAGAAAHAAPITWNFRGTVTQAVFDPFDPLSGAVGPGSPLYTYLNFDTAAVDAVASPDLGSYTLSGGTYGLAAVVGSIAFPLMHSVNISVVDGVGGAPDQYTVFAWEGTPGGLGDYVSLSILLEDATGAAFASDALPGAVPDVSHFGIRSFDLAGQYTDLTGNFLQYEVQGNVIPEPGTPALVGLALAGFGWVRTRRSRCRPQHAEANSVN